MLRENICLLFILRYPSNNTQKDRVHSLTGLFGTFPVIFSDFLHPTLFVGKLIFICASVAYVHMNHSKLALIVGKDGNIQLLYNRCQSHRHSDTDCLFCSFKLSQKPNDDQTKAK